MDKIVKLVPNEPLPVSADAVEILEEALKAAKDGDITSVMVMGMTRTNGCRVMVAWSHDMFQYIGALEVMKAEAVAAMIAGGEDD